MHEQLQNRIRADFPDVLWTRVLKHWGIECGTGWGLLVYGFISDASVLCNEAGGSLEIAQIKEKFGQLHIYCTLRGAKERKAKYDYEPEFFSRIATSRPYPQNPILRTLVDYYQEASSGFCEMCGKPGHIDEVVTAKTGWLRALCFDHSTLMINADEHEPLQPLLEAIDEKTCERMLVRIDEMRAKSA